MADPRTRLDAYLARIGLDRRPAADAAGLARVQQAHRRAIAFENLDIALGRPIAIDGEAVFAKLVGRRRGGYCFEHNRLYADMLAELGFAARPLLARVLLGLGAGDPLPPRTHVLLEVAVAGEPWIADAGFGGSFVPPLPLADGAAAETDDGARHRLRRLRDDPRGDWLLERGGPGGGWQAQYAFTLAPVAQADLEQANHWTSTRPGTRFTTLRIASLALPGGFAALTDGTLRLTEGGATREERIAGERYGAVLAETFGIALTADELAALPPPG